METNHAKTAWGKFRKQYRQPAGPDAHWPRWDNLPPTQRQTIRNAVAKAKANKKNPVTALHRLVGWLRCAVPR